MSIEDLIADLLMQHNCVIVPSFGGFVAGKTSATFDASKESWYHQENPCYSINNY